MTELNTFRNSVLGAKNHRERAREGKKLLGEGRSLSEMKTPPTGMTDGENVERRTEFLSELKQMTEPELRTQLAQLEALIEFRLEQDEKGTSELEWRRIAVLDLLEK
ncbi:MAG: hypothetical protein GW947_01505 [Candidatus Pacebacteria bacterium]|nr:hypothetical protein [Candidatus Paceibacterota bacterium]PIR59791.1 MAG: hypothetical protein COU68_03680 [Candidatus Pacebacteria bacterium CG10_big_fil_rev_8_21_14_0_10_45_6]